MKKKVLFINQHEKCYEDNFISPKPAINYIPQWYKDYPKYIGENNLSSSLNDVKKGNAFPTFKNCVPFFDAFASGYMYETPCDLRVYEKNGTPVIETEPGFEDFVGFRGNQNGFYHSDIYYSEHFYWYPFWAISTPDGYSCLYTTPLNRFDLPFTTISGIIDNDKLAMTGQYPFVLKKGFNGIIKKGTPFVQIIPIQRVQWESSVNILGPAQLELNLSKSPFKYRRKKANVYRENDWERKHYE